ncbi:NifU family protein [Spirillospora sp. NPDC127506]|jgi:hypothetical protein
MADPADPAAPAAPEDGVRAGGTDGGRDGPRRLGAAAVADRLAGLDAALGTLERTPGATAGTAMSAVAMLTEVYGEALARVMDRAPGRLAEKIMDDELLGHLLILHGLHPEPAEQRIVRALDAMARRGAAAEFAGMDGAIVRVRLAGGGCGCGAGQVREAVREAVLAAAPDAAEVEFVEPARARPAAFVPVDALMRRPVPAGDGTP